MNRASIDFAWTRITAGSPRALPCLARKGRAFVAEFKALPAAVLILLTTACFRQAGPIHHSPDSSLHSFQGPGAFSKMEKQMEDNYQVFLDLLNDKQKQINELKQAQGQLPAPREN